VGASANDTDGLNWTDLRRRRRTLRGAEEVVVVGEEVWVRMPVVEWRRLWRRKLGLVLVVGLVVSLLRRCGAEAAAVGIGRRRSPRIVSSRSL